MFVFKQKTAYELRISDWSSDVCSSDLMLWLPMIGIGVAWASIVSLPYAILAGAVPLAKMGIYMGLFNVFIVVPQLVAATLLGFLLTAFFDGAPIFALLIAACSFVLAAIATLFVRE